MRTSDPYGVARHQGHVQADEARRADGTRSLYRDRAATSPPDTSAPRTGHQSRPPREDRRLLKATTPTLRRVSGNLCAPLRVIDHALKVEEHDGLVSDNPGIMSGWNVENVARL